MRVPIWVSAFELECCQPDATVGHERVASVVVLKPPERGTAALEQLTPDLVAIARLAELVGGISLCPFRRINDPTLHVRAFVPGAGVAEDRGTGSAAGPVGVLARRLWCMEPAITIRQGDEIGRACRIGVRAVEGDIKVGGRVTAVAEGGWLL